MAQRAAERRVARRAEREHHRRRRARVAVAEAAAVGRRGVLARGRDGDREADRVGRREQRGERAEVEQREVQIEACGDVMEGRS